MTCNKVVLRNLMLLVTIITSFVSGFYLYLLLDNPIDKEINNIFRIYKNEGDIEYLQSNIHKFIDDKGYEDEDVMLGVSKVCYNVKSANNRLKHLEIKSKLLLTHTKDLISSNESILILCQEPNMKFYYEIGQPIENITTTTNKLVNLKDRKYKLKDTIVDRYPLLSILVFILMFFLIFLLIKKPNEWASYSLKMSAPLFVAMTLLATSLNPLYSLLILILIAYIGFLLIILNRKKSV